MSAKQHFGRERGENKRLIQMYLDKCGLSQTALAVRIGVSRQAVSSVIGGHTHSPKVLDGLREVGVPEDLLHDPRRMEVARKEAA